MTDDRSLVVVFLLGAVAGASLVSRGVPMTVNQIEEAMEFDREPRPSVLSRVKRWVASSTFDFFGLVEILRR